MLILVIPIVIVAIVVLEAVLFQKTWDRDLNVELSFPSMASREGEKSTLTEVVSNGKRMPVPVLTVSYALDTGLLIEEAGNETVSDQTNVLEVFSIRGKEKLTRVLTVDCLKRGYYIINRTSLSSHDMFSRGTGYRNLDQHTHLYVYPRKLSRDILSLPMEKIMGEISTRRFLYENIFLVRGMRDYVPTDPMNTVNFKASARTGDLKVNLHDHSAGLSARILLNVEDPTIWFDDRIMEESISLAAAIAEELIGNGIPVGIITNARDKMAGRNLENPTDLSGSGRKEEQPNPEEGFLEMGEGASADHLRSIEELLARMDLTKEKSPFKDILLHEAMEGRRNEAVTYIFISSSRKPETAEAAEVLGQVKGKLLWIAPLTKDMKDEAVPPHIDFIRMDRNEGS